jgi:hypothetical protein
MVRASSILLHLLANSYLCYCKSLAHMKRALRKKLFLDPYCTCIYVQGACLPRSKRNSANMLSSASLLRVRLPEGLQGRNMQRPLIAEAALCKAAGLSILSASRLYVRFLPASRRIQTVFLRRQITCTKDGNQTNLPCNTCKVPADSLSDVNTKYPYRTWSETEAVLEEMQTASVQRRDQLSSEHSLHAVQRVSS